MGEVLCPEIPEDRSLVLIRKRLFSDERDQLSALSHQQNKCKYKILN
jgi:hypothetical protein